MHLEFVAKRVVVFLLVVWAAATVNFFIPKLSSQNPVRERMLREAFAGGSLQAGMEQMVQEYDKKFGLDKPLWQQYLNYLSDMARLDFNYSITSYPKTVKEIIAQSMPWTIALMGVTAILAFVVGTLMGALLAWPKSPQLLRLLLVPFLTFSAVPYYLLGLILLYFFAFRFRWLPMFGGYSAGTIPYWSWSFAGDVLKHAILPAASILLSMIGYWGLSMRSMMVTVQGEDYMILAEAKGLRDRTRFVRYALRNAVLPQVTALAIAAGYIFSQSVLVEIVFGYPGLGTTLYSAIKGVDYFVIQGIVFTIVLAIALATLILDLALPLLDPRIMTRRS